MGRRPDVHSPRQSLTLASAASRFTPLGCVSALITSCGGSRCPIVRPTKSRLSSSVSRRHWQSPSCSLLKHFPDGSLPHPHPLLEGEGTKKPTPEGWERPGEMRTRDLRTENDYGEQEVHCRCRAYRPPWGTDSPCRQVPLAVCHAEI